MFLFIFFIYFFVQQVFGFKIKIFNAFILGLMYEQSDIQKNIENKFI